MLDNNNNNNINPNFRTNRKDYSKVEIAKINSDELRGNLFNEFRESSFQNISWESEQIAKSHGIYLEFNRARTGNEKDWMYMIRISIPGGGPITFQQWNMLDRIADTYTIGPSDAYPNARPSLKITTRQNIQLHWVRKENIVSVIREIAKSGYFTINGCGDNTRNVIGCPLSFYSKIFNANKWAQKAGKYFALPTAAYIEVFEIDPNYLRKSALLDRELGIDRFDYGANQLNRKFKISFSALHYDEEKKKYIPDNCVELRTNDIGIAPLVNNVNGKIKVDRFQIYVGGSQGQQSGKVTFSALGEPFGIFTEDNLLQGLDAIVRVHKEWGDRQNRHWARLKYLVRVKGIEWFREQVKNVIGGSGSGIRFEPPILDYDYGDRNLHLGWIKQQTDDGDNRSNASDENVDNNNNIKWCYGIFIENGRIIDDSPNGNLKSMIKHLVEKYPSLLLFTTPNQHLLFSNLDNEEKEQFETDMKLFGYGIRKVTLNTHDNSNSIRLSSNAMLQKPYSKLRMLSGACVGRDTCRLTYTDSEKFEPFLIDQLEEKWGCLNESIGVTGCEKQCYRPATKTIGWIGTGFNLYQLTIMGTEDGKYQGGPLIDPDTREQYLHFVPRKDVATVTDALFEYYIGNRISEDEIEEDEHKAGGMGYCLRRVGAKEIISYLKSNPKTAALMKRTFKT
jgi:sulfite reductase (NADPH) hemoprotein beta-component